MSSDLVRTSFKGVLPILMAFIARTENEVLKVAYFRLTSGGKKEYMPDTCIYKQYTRDSVITGVEISFRTLRKRDASVQKVTFLNFDASNPYYTNHQELGLYFDSLQPTTTYLKSASYLLHGYDFDAIRQKLLQISDAILQDDTGFPLKYLDPQIWTYRLYGKYTPPIPIFRKFYQSDLDKLFAGDSNRKSVNFDLGYKAGWGATNLLIAIRKSGGNNPVSSESQKPHD